MKKIVGKDALDKISNHMRDRYRQGGGQGGPGGGYKGGKAGMGRDAEGDEGQPMRRKRPE